MRSDDVEVAVSINGTGTVLLDVPGCATVAEMRRIIAEGTSLDEDLFDMIHEGAVLKEGDSVADVLRLDSCIEATPNAKGRARQDLMTYFNISCDYEQHLDNLIDPTEECGEIVYEKATLLLAAGASLKDDAVYPTLSVVTAAAGNGNYSLLKACVENGADIRRFCSRDTTPVMEAARSGCLKCVSYLVGCGADLNQQSQTSATTPLMFAVMEDAVDVVEFLVAKGANVFEEDGSTSNAAQYACTHGSLRCLIYLMETAKVTADTADEWGQTLLMSAVLRSDPGNLACARYLVENGASLNEKALYCEETALMIATKHGFLDIAQYLVENGADVRVLNSKGQTAWDMAVAQQRSKQNIAAPAGGWPTPSAADLPEEWEFLCPHRIAERARWRLHCWGVVPNPSLCDPREAPAAPAEAEALPQESASEVSEQHEAYTQRLIQVSDKGWPRRRRDTNGRFHICSCDVLQDGGADDDCSSEVSEDEALETVNQRARHYCEAVPRAPSSFMAEVVPEAPAAGVPDNSEVFRTLVRAGADTNFADEAEGRNALMHLCRSGNVACLRYLWGTLPAEDPHGTMSTFLNNVISSPDVDLMQQCQDEDGFTPVMMAAKHGRHECLRYLVRRGALLYELSYESRMSALMYAAGGPCTADATNCVRILIDAMHAEGGDVLEQINSVDRHGRTALMHAARAGNAGAAGLLVSIGCPSMVADTSRRTALDYCMDLPTLSRITRVRDALQLPTGEPVASFSIGGSMRRGSCLPTRRSNTSPKPVRQRQCASHVVASRHLTVPSRKRKVVSPSVPLLNGGSDDDSPTVSEKRARLGSACEA